MISPFVDIPWLRAHREEVVLADVRSYFDGRSGREAYDAGHLPGAVFVELDRWLSAAPTPQDGRHPLPSPQLFAEGMARAGIGDDTTVVAYDDAGGVIAARLVWMLRALEHEAAVLDGGLTAWDGPLSREQPAIVPATFRARPWPAERLADADAAADPANVVVDARQRERFLGEPHPLDPRPGHVPGARALPCRENLRDDDLRLLPVDDLERRLREVGVNGSAPVVAYCGSGVTACHDLLIIEHVGLGHGRLYPGSWSQWASDPKRPVELGASTR